MTPSRASDHLAVWEHGDLCGDHNIEEQGFGHGGALVVGFRSRV